MVWYLFDMVVEHMERDVMWAYGARERLCRYGLGTQIL